MRHVIGLQLDPRYHGITVNAMDGPIARNGAGRCCAGARHALPDDNEVRRCHQPWDVTESRDQSIGTSGGLVSGEGGVVPPRREVAEPRNAVDINLASPNVARVYDAYLDGAQNFASDRDFAREAQKAFPGIRHGVQDNREFLRRSVTYMATKGVRQFLDLGAGIPTIGSVREIARRHRDDARIISVDDDPVVVSSNRQDFLGDPDSLAVWGDLRNPDGILQRPDVQDLFDLEEPVGVLLVAVLHFIASHDEAATIVAGYVREIAAGSYVAISHGSMDAAPVEQQKQLERFVDKYRTTPTPLFLRNHDEVARLFGGLGMVSAFAEDGSAGDHTDNRAEQASEIDSKHGDNVVHLPEWRPDVTLAIPSSLAHRCAWCGVGVKPPP